MLKNKLSMLNSRHKDYLHNESRTYSSISSTLVYTLLNINNLELELSKIVKLRQHSIMLSENSATCTFNKFQFENTVLERDTDFNYKH